MPTNERHAGGNKQRGRSRSRSLDAAASRRERDGGERARGGGEVDATRRKHDSRSRSQSKGRDGHERSRSRSPKRRRRSKSRSRSRSRSPRRHRKHRSRSGSRSPSSNTSRSRSRSRSRDRKRRKGGGDKERSSKHRQGHKRRTSQSRERKDRKKEKKDKKKKKKGGAVTVQWGKYGIINESDMANKEAEFHAWLVEECVVNPETLSKDQTKKHFARFVEDFNTATLPHEKYYEMRKYEFRMNMLRSGELLPVNDSYDAAADMAAHSSRHKRAVVEQESYLSKEQLVELRRVQNERIEAGKMKVLGLEVKQSMGVRMDGNEFESR